jgi:hypothetical protein
VEVYSIKFEGKVLNRGFWLYVIDIRSPMGQHLYVGRTGDSSSANAASPFARIGHHLDFRPNAKGNALARNLGQVGIDPSHCVFEMIAIGPVYPEERDFASHRPVRDRVAALEKGLAVALRQRGYSVLGNHSAALSADQHEVETLLNLIEAKLSRVPAAEQ